MVSCLVGLLLSHGGAEARDVRTIYQGVIRGGVSVDTSGVHVPPNGNNTQYFGPDLQVQIPSTATVEHVYALLTSRAKGYYDGYETGIRINGIPLVAADYLGEVDDPQNRLRIYELPRNPFHIDRAGSYSYSETSKIENPRTDPGIGVLGTTLVVIYSDESHYGRRHVSVFGTIVWLGPDTLTGLPTEQALDDGVMSINMGLEPWFDQVNWIHVDDVEITRKAGGADDGDQPEGYTRPISNQGSLITGGSFGVNDLDEVVGIDGDDPDSEPVGGTLNNSRLSDELYRVHHDGSGSMVFDLRRTNHMMDDQWITNVTLSIEVDTDEDGAEDAVDPDIDGDGLLNEEEEAERTDVYAWDTDGDGASDGAEVLAGTNPLR